MAPLTMLWFRSESTVPYTSNRDNRESALVSGSGTWVVTRLKSIGAHARTFAGFDHAEFIQISRFPRPARRAGVRRGVLARDLCQISATRDHRDHSARQVPQKSLMPETRRGDEPPARNNRRGIGRIISRHARSRTRRRHEYPFRLSERSR